MWDELLVVTDLDGTLLNSSRFLSDKNRSVLAEIRDKSVKVAIATGRSLYAARKVMDAGFPCDFLISSTGAGIYRWPDCELLKSNAFESDHIMPILDYLKRLNVDFMIHDDLPDNHRFSFWKGKDGSNQDFHDRCERYRSFGRHLGGTSPQKASQFLIVDSEDSQVFEEVRNSLRRCSVVRVTSPLDGKSIWIEIFPEGVSKSNAAEWLKNQIARKTTLAIGNDYNDIDLLKWADEAYVVENSVKEVYDAFPHCPSNDNDGVAHAILACLKNAGLSLSV